MNLYFRLLLILLEFWWRKIAPWAKQKGKRDSFLDEQTFKGRVYPTDLDSNLHMNNGRYLTLMDLGRLQLMLETRVISKILKNRWFPVLAGAQIVYRKPLHLFEKFEIKTKVLYYDQKWFYIRQSFHAGGRLVAFALVKGLFRGQGKSIPNADLFSLQGEGYPKTSHETPPPLVEKMFSKKDFQEFDEWLSR